MNILVLDSSDGETAVPQSDLTSTGFSSSEDSSSIKGRTSFSSGIPGSSSVSGALAAT